MHWKTNVSPKILATGTTVKSKLLKEEFIILQEFINKRNVLIKKMNRNKWGRLLRSNRTKKGIINSKGKRLELKKSGWQRCFMQVDGDLLRIWNAGGILLENIDALEDLQTASWADRLCPLETCPHSKDPR